MIVIVVIVVIMVVVIVIVVIVVVVIVIAVIVIAVIVVAVIVIVIVVPFANGLPCFLVTLPRPAGAHSRYAVQAVVGDVVLTTKLPLPASHGLVYTESLLVSVSVVFVGIFNTGQPKGLTIQAFMKMRVHPRHHMAPMNPVIFALLETVVGLGANSVPGVAVVVVVVVGFLIVV